MYRAKTLPRVRIKSLSTIGETETDLHEDFVSIVTFKCQIGPKTVPGYCLVGWIPEGSKTDLDDCFIQRTTRTEWRVCFPSSQSTEEHGIPEAWIDLVRDVEEDRPVFDIRITGRTLSEFEDTLLVTLSGNEEDILKFVDQLNNKIREVTKKEVRERLQPPSPQKVWDFFGSKDNKDYTYYISEKVRIGNYLGLGVVAVLQEEGKNPQIIPWPQPDDFGEVFELGSPKGLVAGGIGGGRHPSGSG